MCLAASVILSVCVCLHCKTKMAETKITKLGTGIVHHLSHQLILGQKVKVQGHTGKNTKKDRVAGVSYALCGVPSL